MPGSEFIRSLQLIGLSTSAVAGLLVAPDLIGVEALNGPRDRIVFLHRRVNTALEHRRTLLHGVTTEMRRRGLATYVFTLFLLLILALVVLLPLPNLSKPFATSDIVYYSLACTVFILMFLLLTWMSLTFPINRLPGGQRPLHSAIAAHGISIARHMAQGALWGSFLIVSLLIALVVQVWRDLLVSLVSRLQQRQIRKTLRRWGISLYLVGSLLQILAAVLE